jgi:hypothetical protein
LLIWVGCQFAWGSDERRFAAIKSWIFQGMGSNVPQQKQGGPSWQAMEPNPQQPLEPMPPKNPAAQPPR